MIFDKPYVDSDGAYPYDGLILSGNTLYGTATSGGSSGNGTIFSLSFTPQLSIVPSSATFILRWPTSYAGIDYSSYTLQSVTNLGSSAVWTTIFPVSILVNGQNTVTNPISGTLQFFRLCGFRRCRTPVPILSDTIPGLSDSYRSEATLWKDS